MDPGSITRLLRELDAGEPAAEERLFAMVYDELRAMARRGLAGERGERDSGELVHDAYERLAGEAFENRRHLFFAYARAMRQILVERARRARAAKRGGGRPLVSLDGTADGAVARPHGLDALDLEGVLDRLREAAPREADVVVLRCHGGLSDAAIGEVLGVDPRTVRRDWASARSRFLAWLDTGDSGSRAGPLSL